MSFTIYSMLKAILLVANALAILNDKYFLNKCLSLHFILSVLFDFVFLQMDGVSRFRTASKQTRSRIVLLACCMPLE